ncbi:hypothetical protein Tcan_03898 [Toxocara canis]|uniref:Uncharacterized protein n=1 Tax=Toxocara canis TaxID=6265 RepID=A0A0B2UPC1_TOXCA|nr:hypothetical protein Tcan_03898 [Toxocara canis]
MNDLDHKEEVTHGWPSGLRRQTQATGFLRVMRVWVGEQYDSSARSSQICQTRMISTNMELRMELESDPVLKRG